MSNLQFTPAKKGEKAFNCPHCQVYAKQDWTVNVQGQFGSTNRSFQEKAFSLCHHCIKTSIWIEDKLVYPESTQAPPVNTDLPEDIQVDYNEASAILSDSPRGAAALLRLCIQKLCIHFGEPGKDLNKDIGALVAKGLLPTIKECLDIVRVIGNEAVHPGVIDLNDKPEIAVRLFELINIITQTMITQPIMIEELNKQIPLGKLERIEQRDKPKE